MTREKHVREGRQQEKAELQSQVVWGRGTQSNKNKTKENKSKNHGGQKEARSLLTAAHKVCRSRKPKRINSELLVLEREFSQ